MFLRHVPNEIAFIGLCTDRMSALRDSKAGKQEWDDEKKSKSQRRPAD